MAPRYRLFALAVVVALLLLVMASVLTPFILQGRIFHDQPINFYARIVDQNAHPVRAVRVRAIVYQRPWIAVPFLWSPVDEDHVDTVTNASGRFTIRAWRGHFLSIRSIKKKGFFIHGPREVSFGVARTPSGAYNGSPAKPALYSAWRIEAGAAKLVQGKWMDLRLLRLGQTAIFDLLDGRGDMSERGDLAVTFVKVPAKLKAKGCRFAYRLEVLDGGLRQANGPFPWRAPRKGYRRSTVVYNFGNAPYPRLPRGATFANGFDLKFFLRLLHGHVYARSSVTSEYSGPNHGGPELFVAGRYYIAPIGSRDLQQSPRGAAKTDNPADRRKYIKPLLALRQKYWAARRGARRAKKH